MYFCFFASVSRRRVPFRSSRIRIWHGLKISLDEEPPDDYKKSKEKEERNQMGEWQFRKLNGYVVTKTSCGKSESDIFCPGKGASEKGECKKFGPTKWIFVLVT